MSGQDLFNRVVKRVGFILGGAPENGLALCAEILAKQSKMLDLSVIDPVE